MARRVEVFGVEVNGDISGLKKAMNDAVAVFKSTERAIKNIDDAIKADPNDETLLTQKIELQKKAIEENRKAVRELYKIQKEITSDPNFKKGVTDLTERYADLQKTLKKTKKEGADLKKELKDTRNELAQFTLNKKFEALNDQLKKSKEIIDSLKKSAKNIDEAIKLDPNNLDLYVKKQEVLQQTLAVTEKALENLRKKQEEYTSDPLFFKNVNGVKDKYTEIETEIKKLETEYDNLLRLAGRSPEMSMFVDQIDKLGDAFLQAANATQRFSRFFQVMLGSAFQSSVDFETEIAGIQKIVKDLSTDTVEDLKDIAVETGNAFEDIAEYAKIGGALGLTEQELAKFTRTMVDLNTATGGVFSGEEGAKGIAVFLKQLGLGIDQAENFGSAIAVIGDKYADIGDETVNIATKLTGLTALVKTDQYQLLGLAGVMADLGLSSDASANAINRAFLQIEKVLADTSNKGIAKMKTLASASGMTVKQFKEEWGTDAVNTFLKFTDGLKSSFFNEIDSAIASSSSKITEFANTLGWSAEYFVKRWGEDSKGVFDEYVAKLGELEDEGESASVVLKDLGISSVNVAQTLLRLSGSGNEVRKAMTLAKDAWEENTALAEKSGVIYETAERKLEAFKESWRQMSSSFTNVFLPVVKSVVDGLNVLMNDIEHMNPVVKGLFVTFSMGAAAFSPTLRALGNLDKAIGKLVDPEKGLPHLSKALDTFAGHINMFGVGVAGTVIALTAGTIALGNYLNKIDNASTPLKKLKDEINSTKDSFEEYTHALSNSLYESDYALYKETQSIRDQIEAIEELKEKIKDNTLTEKEAKETKDELKAKIEELNGALGTSFYYNGKQQEILDENKDVANLTKAYEELLLAKRKATFLEESQETYNKALQDEAKAMQTIADTKWEYYQATKNYDDEIVAFAEHYAKHASEFETQKMFAELPQSVQTAVITIADLYNKASDTVNASKELADEANNIITTVDMVANATGDDLERMMDAIKNGWDVDPAKNDLAELYGDLEKVNYLLQNPEGLSMDNILQLEGLRDEILKQIEAVQLAKQEAGALKDIHNEMFNEFGQRYDEMKQKNIEVYETDTDSILNTTTTSWEAIKDTSGHATSEIFDDYKAKGYAANSELQGYFSANPLRQTVIVTPILSGSIGPLFTGASIGSSGRSIVRSTGYGDLIMQTMDAIRNSMQGVAFKSGGFHSGTQLTLNANFNVTSNSVGRQEVKAWANWLLDDINEGLGKEM